jgi:hypothetical protein
MVFGLKGYGLKGCGQKCYGLIMMRASPHQAAAGKAPAQAGPRLRGSPSLALRLAVSGRR